MQGEDGKPMFKMDESREEASDRFTALHHQFVASALAVKLGHEINPNNKIGLMIAGMMVYPYTPNPKDVKEAQDKMNMSNWFCGDVQVRGHYPYYAKRYFKDNNITVRMRISTEEANQKQFLVKY